MVAPFQCNLCHFCNVDKRDPVPGEPKDDFTMLVMRRAELDCRWSRETSTVLGNTRRMRLDCADAEAHLSIKRQVPELGSEKLEDRMGMGIAITILNASLRKGRYAEHSQWDSMRKTASTYNNAFEAGEDFRAGSIYASYDKKMYESQAPTASKWFSRFMLGTKRRMGVIRKQDEALTVDQLNAIMELGEKDWRKSKCDEEKKEIECLMAFIVIGFCVSLRGEEVPLVALDGMLEF